MSSNKRLNTNNTNYIKQDNYIKPHYKISFSPIIKTNKKSINISKKKESDPYKLIKMQISSEINLVKSSLKFNIKIKSIISQLKFHLHQAKEYLNFNDKNLEQRINFINKNIEILNKKSDNCNNIEVLNNTIEKDIKYYFDKISYTKLKENELKGIKNKKINEYNNILIKMKELDNDKAQINELKKENINLYHNYNDYIYQIIMLYYQNYFFRYLIKKDNKNIFIFFNDKSNYSQPFNIKNIFSISNGVLRFDDYFQKYINLKFKPTKIFNNNTNSFTFLFKTYLTSFFIYNELIILNLFFKNFNALIEYIMADFDNYGYANYIYKVNNLIRYKNNTLHLKHYFNTNNNKDMTFIIILNDNTYDGLIFDFINNLIIIINDFLENYQLKYDSNISIYNNIKLLCNFNFNNGNLYQTINNILNDNSNNHDLYFKISYFSKYNIINYNVILLCNKDIENNINLINSKKIDHIFNNNNNITININNIFYLLFLRNLINITDPNITNITDEYISILKTLFNN